VILHRYILRQVVVPVLVAALLLNVLFLLVELLRIASVAVGVGLRLADLGWMSLLLLPGLSVFTIPVAVLMGIMLGFGRLAEDGELVALAGAGIGPGRVLKMPALLGAAAALLGMVVSVWFTPAAARTMRGLFVDLTRRNVAASLDSSKFYEELPGLVLLCGPRRGPGAWQGFFAYDLRDRELPLLLVANQARVGDSSGADLELQLQDGQACLLQDEQRRQTIAAFSRGRVRLALDVLVSDRTRFLSPTDHLYLAQLREMAADARQPIRLRKLCQAAWHRRFAFPLAALIFACLAVLMVAPGRGQSRSRSLWLAVALVAGYFLLMRTGDALVEKGILSPSYSAWLPDVLLTMAGWWLWRRRQGVAR